MVKDEAKSGIIEAVREHNYDQAPIHFLRLHGVIRSDRETTKLRALFEPKVIHTDIEQCNTIIARDMQPTYYGSCVMVRRAYQTVRLTS